MKVSIKTRAVSRGMQWLSRVFLLSAVLLLGYCGYVVADAWVFQHLAAQSFEAQVQAHSNIREASPAVEQNTTATQNVPAVASDGSIGRLEIPDVGLSVMVEEGTDESTLQRAAGHIEGTALPGRPGNIGIAGHRDTFFRPLRNLHRDNIITLTTLRGAYRYRVLSTKVVKPDDVSVLRADQQDILTLVTCYPFYFVGPAPNRFIVRAERVL